MAPPTHPLSNAKEDITILHASEIDLSSLLPPPPTDSSSDPHNESLAASYDFVLSAREALRIAKEGEVEREGHKVDSLRDTLEGIVAGLEGRD